MRKIVYTLPNGNLAVVHPVRNTLGETLQTDSEIEQRALAKLPADAIDPTWVDSVPTDRTFRNAWAKSGNGVSVNMPKARGLHRERLRQLRAPKLAALDVEYMRADEQGAVELKDAIKRRKQFLRDVTSDPRIDAATTPEELAQVIPSALKDD